MELAGLELATSWVRCAQRCQLAGSLRSGPARAQSEAGTRPVVRHGGLSDACFASDTGARPRGHRDAWISPGAGERAASARTPASPPKQQRGSCCAGRTNGNGSRRLSRATWRNDGPRCCLPVRWHGARARRQLQFGRGRGCPGCTGAVTTLVQDASRGGCGEKSDHDGIDQRGVVQAKMRGCGACDQGW
jgi:hypothetical protein